MRLRRRDRFWLKTTLLMWSMLVLLAIVTLLLPLYASALNLLTFIGYPLGFYMSAQGALIAIAALVFLFSRLQDRVDSRALETDAERSGE